MLEGSPRRRSSAVVIASAFALLAPACLDRPLCAVDCQPKTTNQFVLRVETKRIDKIDLLFMIDNSASMADKQALLRRAVPSLVSRFVNPLCVDEHRVANGHHFENGQCASGAPEFPPIPDIHIGIISSSLGAAGGMNACNATNYPEVNDHAWLLPQARPALGLDSWNRSGFLAWDPLGTRNQPPGTADASALSGEFQDMVSDVGEHGCGFEASLEAWYRFLVSPDPPRTVAIQGNSTVVSGVDDALLAQRRAFLRPDSLVAIVMLTDENDCSIREAGSAFALSDWASMPRATSACAKDPSDVCCRSCGIHETAPPPGCAPLTQDSECAKNEGKLDATEDSPNMRCWDQKRRFGADFLEPVGKYIQALTSNTVLDRNGAPKPNPLFTDANGAVVRDRGMVYLAGIIGVPWQDIASEDSLTGDGLRYLTAAEIEAEGRWDVVLGDPSKRILPSDPHMIESTTPRSGTHPFLSTATLAPAEASVPPTADAISGHEQATPGQDDLEYACTFELETPEDCSQSSCDCESKYVNANRPLCQPPSGGAFGTMQYYAKAYPGLRQLEVLHGIGDQAIVASICPKRVRSADPGSDPSYGYNPAMAALVDRLRPLLADQCLARAPEVDAEGRISCVAVEANLGQSCDCSAAGRSQPTPEVVDSVREDLRKSGFCDGAGQPECASLCACQLQEVAKDALAACRSAGNPDTQQPGFCYVDPERGLGDPALVQNCPDNRRRLLRFVGPDTPRKGTIAYMACMGQPPHE